MDCLFSYFVKSFLLLFTENKSNSTAIIGNATQLLGKSLTTAGSDDEVKHYLTLAIVVTIVSVSIRLYSVPKTLLLITIFSFLSSIINIFLMLYFLGSSSIDHSRSP